MRTATLLCAAIPAVHAAAQPVAYAWGHAFDLSDNQTFHEEDIATAPNGDVLLAGSFDQAVDLDPGTGTHVLEPFGGGEGFVLCLDASGGFRWAAPMGRRAAQVATTASGDVYLSGNYLDGYDLDPGPDVLSPVIGPVPAAYIAKLDADGALIWARVIPCAGATPEISAQVLGVLPDGSVTFGGLVDGTADMDPGAGDATLTTSACNLCSEGYLVHLSGDGTYGWSDHFRLDEPMTNGAMTPLALAIDAAGHHYLAGSFNGVIDFDPGPGESLDDGLSADSFVLELDADGTFLWMLPVGDGQNVHLQQVGVDADGAHVVCGGYFLGPADLAPGPVTSVHTSGAQSDICAIALDGDGGFQWAAPFYGTDLEELFDLQVSASGDAYLLGGFSHGYMDLDPGAGNIEHADDASGFLVALDAAGAYRWSAPLNTDLSVLRDAHLAMDGSGNVHLTGREARGLDLDPGPGTITLDAAFGETFVTRWTATGSAIADHTSAYPISAWPNPCNAVLRLRSDAPGPVAIDLRNELGQQLLRLDRFDPQRDAIDLRGLPAGLLLLHVRNTDAGTTLPILHQP